MADDIVERIEAFQADLERLERNVGSGPKLFHVRGDIQFMADIKAEIERLRASRSSLVERCWQELLDRDDRTSPEEYPDMALINREELADFMGRAAVPPSKGTDDEG